LTGGVPNIPTNGAIVYDSGNMTSKMLYTPLEIEAYRRWFERQIAAGNIAARHEYIWWLAAVEGARKQSPVLR
jgi:hypothetical protein